MSTYDLKLPEVITPQALVAFSADYVSWSTASVLDDDSGGRACFGKELQDIYKLIDYIEAKYNMHVSVMGCMDILYDFGTNNNINKDNVESVFMNLLLKYARRVA